MSREHRVWVEGCPLRQWRKRRGISIHEAAGLIGVSASLIQLWERGVHVPSGENRVRLVQQIGIPAWERWGGWYNRRPLPPPGKETGGH